MFRWVLGACLVVLGMWRVGVWKESRDQAWRLCTHAGQHTPTAVRGEAGSRGGREALKGPEIRTLDGSWEQFSGAVNFPSGVSLTQGLGWEVVGFWSCRRTPRNPARVADGVGAFRLPSIVLRGSPHLVTPYAFERSLRGRLHDSLRLWVTRTPAGHRLNGLMRAVWLGETGGLPVSLVESYRKLGISHVLALSGQHVIALAILLRSLWRALFQFLFLCGFRPCGLIFHRLNEALPLFAAGLLWLGADGNASIARTGAMVLSLTCLRCRAYRSSAAQITATSVAVLILVDPAFVLQKGFVLSAVATYFLVEISLKDGGFRDYLSLSIAMPLVMVPAIAFLQASLPILAIPATFLVSWMWDLAWIPLGFSLPVIFSLCPPLGRWTVRAADPIWAHFLASHPSLAEISPEWIVPRPTWLEWLVCQATVLCAVKAWRSWRIAGRRIDASSIAQSELTLRK